MEAYDVHRIDGPQGRDLVWGGDRAQAVWTDRYIGSRLLRRLGM